MAAIHLSAPSFVELAADQERQAVEALAELLVALLNAPIHRATDHQASDDVAPIGDT